MTVAELIAQLADMPADAEVLVYNPADDDLDIEYLKLTGWGVEIHAR